MDERHWWLTSKVSQTFHEIMQDDHTILEDFMADTNTIEALNNFLEVDGEKLIYFYLSKTDVLLHETEKKCLRIGTSAIENFHKTLSDLHACVYFIRKDTNKQISVNNIEQEVLSGEIKQEGITLCSNIIKNVFTALTLNKTDWSFAEKSDTEDFAYELEKYSRTLTEYSNAVIAPSQILNIPNDLIVTNFRRNRQISSNIQIVADYEKLVLDWSKCIENFLLDCLDDRYELYTSPMSMLLEWKRRQKLIQSIIDQLKVKELKSVIAVLIAGKSKVLKRWKVVDAGVTDVFNDVKDKSKYLESFRRCFENFQPDARLFQLSSSILPDFYSGVKQLDSASKFYGRTGFLGSLLAKVSYQVVAVCKQNIQIFVAHQKVDVNLQLWYSMYDEVLTGKVSTNKNKLKKKLTANTPASLSTLLYDMLSIFNQYEEMIHSLCDSISFNQRAQNPMAVNNLHILSKRLRSTVVGGEINQTSTSSSEKKSTDVAETTHQNADPESSISTSEVSLTDEEIISYPLIIFKEYILQLIDIIETLKQLQKLIKTTKTLPRLTESQMNSAVTDSVKTDNQDGSEVGSINTTLIVTTSSDAFSVSDYTVPSFSKTLNRNVTVMMEQLKHEMTLNTFIEYDGSGKGKFDAAYLKFVKAIQNVESNIRNYINAAFSLKWNTAQMLHILSCFNPVLYRTALSSLFEGMYSKVISSFEQDLEMVVKEYESKKTKPPVFRNMPVLSSAVYWSRGLFHRIEKTMSELKNLKSITNKNKKYTIIVKQYNCVATVLFQFEETWLNMWRTQTESCGKLLNTTLLAVDVSSGKVIVYSDPRLLEVFSDVKFLTSIGIRISKHIKEVFQQENKFKNYKQTLDHLVSQYYTIVKKIPEHLLPISKSLCEATLAYFQPGLSVLKWNSINIDAFLHKVQCAIDQFNHSISTVLDICHSDINYSIQAVKDFVLFDTNTLSMLRRSPSEFLESHYKSLQEIGKALNNIICSVESSLQRISRILINKPTSLSNHKSSNLHSTKSEEYAVGFLGADPHDVVSPISFSTDKKIIADLFAYYSTEIFEAVRASTRQSLETYFLCVKNISGDDSSKLSFLVDVTFALPHVKLIPSLTDVQDVVSQAAKSIVGISSNVYWWDFQCKQTFCEAITNDQKVKETQAKLDVVITDIQSKIDKNLFVFHKFNFLWMDDMNTLYNSMENENPSLDVHHAEVKRILLIEKDITDIHDLIDVSPVFLNTTPIKDSLQGLCLAWKMCYTQKLQRTAKISLQAISSQQQTFLSLLNVETKSLHDLNNLLNEIQKIFDMENEIDDTYTPVEELYDKLSREYQIPIEREQLDTVKSLRDNWNELVVAAEEASQKLMREQRAVFEQQLDKNLKDFVVEVIQFRNRFDSQGPGIPGISPSIAVARLKEFQSEYMTFDKKQETLHAVQRLYGISPSPFDELNKTGEELKLLGMLYELFQKYVHFDTLFRDTLWADVHLETAASEIHIMWELCMKLPSAIHSWFAYKELKNLLFNYLEILPVLHQLSSKEIRNRHWLRVMHVTKNSFQLEANILKLDHIMDIGLLNHKEKISKIFQSSQAELDLETKLQKIEEEWTEQILKFVKFKSRGVIIFDKCHMNYLLDILEDGKTSLSVMLASKYIKPLREEAASWAVKLNEISEVLEQWLSVEELWVNLEAVFNSEETAKALPQQFATFLQADRSYMKLMKKTVETANVVQCCLGGDVSVMVTLKQIYRDLECCFMELEGYLDGKRKSFPRFNFVSNSVLLSMLSKPYNMESVQPHIKEVISGIAHVETVSEDFVFKHLEENLENSNKVLPAEIRLALDSSKVIFQKERFSNAFNSMERQTNKRKSLSHFEASLQRIDQFDREWLKQLPPKSITAVIDMYDERLDLCEKVSVGGLVEEWLSKLLLETKSSVNTYMMRCMESIMTGSPMEDIVLTYPCQVGLMGFLFYWTKECTKAINDIRHERKSLANFVKKFQMLTNRFCQMLVRGFWKTNSLTTVQKLRFKSIVGVGLYLRDTFDELVNHKIRDINDFEWKQILKCLFIENDDDKKIQLQMLDNCFDYHNEFLGCNMTLVMSPATERCLLNLMQAVINQDIGCISAPDLVGKSELVKGLSNLFGQHLITIECMTTISPQTLHKIFVGIAEDGSWCCFKNFQCYTKELMIQLQYHARTIQQCLKNNASTINLSSTHDVRIIPTCRVFLTTSLQFMHSTCLQSFKLLLRNVSFSKPDCLSIMRTQLIAHGFKASRTLATKIKMLTNICQNQLKSPWSLSLPVLKVLIKAASRKLLILNSNISNSEGETPRIEPITPAVGTFSRSGTKTPTAKGHVSVVPSAFSEIVSQEANIMIQTLQEIIGTRLSDQDLVVFKSILKSVFGPAAKSCAITNTKYEERLFTIVKEVMKEKGLTLHKPFIDKVMQLYQLTLVHHGIIICGPCFSGKTSCFSVLIEALREMNSQLSTQLTYKCEHLNVLAGSDLSVMFGEHNGNTVTDGIVTILLKKALKHMLSDKVSTWITLDGPLHDAWCWQLKNVLDQSKVLVQPDFERHYLTEHVKLLFETDSLADASPSVLPIMGILYMDNSVLGWKPMADAWLAKYPAQQFHTLQHAFNKTVDRMLLFVQEEAEMCVQISDCALFSSCLNMLSSLLKEHTDLAGDLHVERLYIFSLIWTFGGLLVKETDRKQFNTLLLSLTNALPDDDGGISVFDYYLDESGEWDTWDTRFNGGGNSELADAFGELYVDTFSTSRVKFLLELFASSECNTLLVGGRCVGKTSMMADLFHKQAKPNEMIRNTVFSHNTNASFLQQFVDSSLYHKQGFRYGARGNKLFKLCIDDLHLPNFDVCEEQSANQLLRQLMDQNVLYSKSCSPKLIEGLHVAATFNSFDITVRKQKQKYSRLLGRFCIVLLSEMNVNQISSISSLLLDANMTDNQGMSLPQVMHEEIVAASSELLARLNEMFGSKTDCLSLNYLFNINDLSRVFQMLKHCPEELRVDEGEDYLQLFWLHEVHRTFLDKISDSEDIARFNNTLEDILKKHFSIVTQDLRLFTTFSTTSHLRSQRQNLLNKPKKVIFHQCINSIQECQDCIKYYIRQYENEKNQVLDIVLHNFNLQQTVNIHRVLSADSNGNSIHVSWELNQTKHMVQLVTFMLSHEEFIIDCSNSQTFFNGLRAAVRMAGCDQKNVVLLFEASDLNKSLFLEVLHSLMAQGEYAPLFGDTELNGLYLALRPIIKKFHPNYVNNPRGFFCNSVKKNLHIVILTMPDQNFITFLNRCYPAIVTCSYVHQYSDYMQVRLAEEASICLETGSFWKNYKKETRDKVINVLESVHKVIAKTYNELYPSETPAASDVLRAKVVDRIKSSKRCAVLVNISIYQKFLHCFKYLMQRKAEQMEHEGEKKRLALDCLLKAELKAKKMASDKVDLNKEYEQFETKTNMLCEELFAKSALIERLKAKYEPTDGSFQAFMALIDNEMIDTDDEFEWTDEHDELDEEYERLQPSYTENLKTLQEQIEETEDMLESMGKEMETAKELLTSFQIQIERGCIERLRAYQSPPALVGSVMVMLMVLLGRPEFSGYVSTPTREKRLDGASCVVDNSLSRTSSGKSRRPKETKLTVPNIIQDGRVDRNTWKTIQQIMQDSQKFCDIMNTYDWSNGISDEILKAVISFFAAGQEVPQVYRTGVQPSSKSDTKGGITLQAAKYSSEDAAQIVEYVQKVIYFTRKHKPFVATVKKFEGLKHKQEEQEKKRHQPENLETFTEAFPESKQEDIIESLTEADLTRLQSELLMLQQQYDECALKKNELKENIVEFTILLDATTALLESMKPLKVEWKKFADSYADDDKILTHAVLTSAVSSYCTTLNIDQREAMTKKFVELCIENGFNVDKDVLLNKSYLLSFLGNKNEIKHLELVYPTYDKMVVDTSVLLHQLDLSNSWPLLCDPHNIGLLLLKKICHGVMLVNFDELDSVLEKALQDGSKVFLLDVDLKMVPPKLAAIMHSYSKFRTTKEAFKLTIENKVLECSPHFRLFMFTSVDCGEVPVEILPYVHCLQVSTSRQLLYEIFLNDYILKEKSQIEDSLYAVNKEIVTQEKAMESLEEELVVILNDTSCFENITDIRKFSYCRKLHEDARQTLLRAVESYYIIQKSRAVYKPIAMQASILFEGCTMMRRVNQLYQLSIQQFLWYFNITIKHSDRGAVSVIADKVLSSLFYILSKAKLEVDRPLFSLYTALEIEDCHGRVSCGDREFLINPHYGAAVRQFLQNSESSANVLQQKSNVKKPFDWMTDEQYFNLLNLSNYFDWFSEPFDKMAKDGREMQWRQIAESDTPELVPLPDNLDDKYSPLQRFMVIRAFRPDRFQQTSTIFVSMVTGKRFASDPPLDMKYIYHLTSPTKPVLFLYGDHHQLCEMNILELSELKQVELLTYDVNGVSGEDAIVEALIKEATSKGCWVYLIDVQFNLPLMKKVFKLIQDRKYDQDFRLWLSADLSHNFPIKFLHTCISLVVDPPRLNFHKTLVENLTLATSHTFRSGVTIDWSVLLHNVCMLHSSLNLRRRCAGFAVNDTNAFNFGVAKLLESVQIINHEISKEDCKPTVTPTSTTKVFPWTAIRALLLKMVYGREITHRKDLAALSCLVEFWMSSNATRKDFEIPRARYKIPGVAFNNSSKFTSVIQALENLPTSMFDSMEFSGVFTAPEVNVKAINYYLSNLKELYDAMPSSGSLVHALESFIYMKCTDSPCVDQTYPFIHSSFAMIKYSRKINLHELVSNALAKLPRLWSKEFVSERIRKTGGMTSYNMWLLCEADHICVLHHTVKTTLQKIQGLLTTDSCSWNITPDMLKDVIDLYGGKVPKRWCDKAGISAPPQSWNVIPWMGDLSHRCSHIEKILMQGREKMAGYWLAAFFNPKRLISVIMQESVETSHLSDTSADQLSVRAEMTNRDKDHLRDPPSEGIFVYGLHLWETHWEKATNDIHDVPAKLVPYSLPVVQFSYTSQAEKSAAFSVPCYPSRLCKDAVVLNVEVEQKETSYMKLSLRGVTCTLRPF